MLAKDPYAKWTTEKGGKALEAAEGGAWGLTNLQLLALTNRGEPGGRQYGSVGSWYQGGGLGGVPLSGWGGGGGGKAGAGAVSQGASGSGGAGALGGGQAGAGAGATGGGGVGALGGGQAGGAGAAAGSKAAAYAKWLKYGNSALQGINSYMSAREQAKLAKEAGKPRQSSQYWTPYGNEYIARLMPYLISAQQPIFESRMRTYGFDLSKLPSYTPIAEMLAGVSPQYAGVGMPGQPYQNG